MKKIDLKGLSKTQTIILTAVITALIVTIIPLGIFSGINHESPFRAVKDIFTPDTQQIVGKWQDETAILGYEFYDDGTYDYHTTSKVTITKDYQIKGNQLTLIDYNTNANVIYKFSINNDVLKLTLLESNGKKPNKNEKVTTEYKKVNHFNLKSPYDAIADFAEEAKAESETTEKAEE